MPRDEWKRANDRTAYGPATPRSTKLRKTKRKRRKGKRKPRTGPGAWSGSTVLWFGKHKGTPIRDAPPDYLRWLAEQEASTPNVAALVAWLRSGYNLNRGH